MCTADTSSQTYSHLADITKSI